MKTTMLSNKIAKIVFASAAVLLILLSYNLYTQIDYHLTAYNKINDVNVIKLKLEKTLSALKDAESAQRGFLLTKDSSFLEPYQGAHDKAGELLKELHSLTYADEEQRPHVNALATLVELRFNTFHNVIEQYTAPELNEDTRKQHLLRGKSAADSIRYHVNAIVGNENIALQKLEREKILYNFMTPFYTLLFFSSALGIVVFSYFKIIQALKRSKLFGNKLKQLNKELKKKNHELELYNKELDSFTYIASHDLREPLRKIMTFSNIIEETEGNKLSRDNQKHFQRIRLAAFRMQNLLNDLLSYSHTTMSDKSFEWVDLNEVVANVCQNIHEEISETNAQVDFQDLPVVKGLSFQLHQLFENLILNSIKYRKPGIPPHIVISGSIVEKNMVRTKQFKAAHCYHKIVISDNGLGFDQAYSEKIFELFQRVHLDDPYTGTGIGLTICKKILQNHNGFIVGKGEINLGATFEIYLPAEGIGATMHEAAAPITEIG